MPKTKPKKPLEVWKQTPEEHDFPAAAEYLSLLFPEPTAQRLADQLRNAPTIHRKAKDLLRASDLPLLAAEDVEVTKDLKRAASGTPLSPVLLVRSRYGLRLIVADGYHRICASYHLTEDADVPCRMVELGERDAPAPGSTDSPDTGSRPAG
jgi:hypothetical protein